MLIPDYDPPNEVIMDVLSGIALNVPVSKQYYPGWWNEEPARYARVKAERERLGIVVDDFPNGTERVKESFERIPMEEM